MSLLLVTSVLSRAEETAEIEPVVIKAETGIVEQQVIVLEDGTEEVCIIAPRSEGVHRFADKRILAIEKQTRAKIHAVQEEIDRLADKSDAGELQKEIQRIKLDAEIARLKILIKDAEDAGDLELIDALGKEIEYLETQDEPIPVIPKEKTVPEPVTGKGKGGK